MMGKKRNLDESFLFQKSCRYLFIPLRERTSIGDVENEEHDVVF